MKKKLAILMSILMFAMVGCESRPITPMAPVGENVQAQGEQAPEEQAQEEGAEVMPEEAQ